MLSFHRSTTFQSSRDEVTVPYTQGNWQGYLASDSVSIPSMNLTVEDATLSCITSSENFFINNSHWQGILGLAYAQIARVRHCTKSPPTRTASFCQAHFAWDKFHFTVPRMGYGLCQKFELSNFLQTDALLSILCNNLVSVVIIALVSL